MSPPINHRLLLVIPSYNEAERLPRFLPPLAQALQNVDCLIQVVDDGSKSHHVETTRALVEKVRTVFPMNVAPLLELPVNQGKGAAIRAGWRLHSRSSLLGFVDADGAISASEVRRFIDLALGGPENAYFASRIKMLGRQVVRAPLRHYVGRIFSTVVSLRLNLPVYDSQCGLKIVPGKLFENGDAPFSENGFAFDLELLVASLDQGYIVSEVPIDWTHISGSKVNLILDSLRIFLALERLTKRRHIWISRNKVR